MVPPRILPLAALLLALPAVLDAAAIAAEPAALPSAFAAYATPIEEPWNSVIHDALLAAQRGGRLRYAWQDNLATPAAINAAIEQRLADGLDLVVTDGDGGMDGIRRIAAAHPQVAFLVGTGEPPVAPNLSVFDSDLAEPAYLCGILAGRLTTRNIVGVVAGKSDPHVHRTVNAFIKGVRDANPAARVKVDFIGSWFDPPQARAAALRQIDAGADLIYAEREGALAAARERGVRGFGNLVDQHAEAPDTVITGPTWSMTPVIDHLLKLRGAATVTAESFLDFSTLRRGGAALAPWHGWDEKLPADALQFLRERQTALKAGTLVLEVGEERPVGD